MIVGCLEIVSGPQTTFRLARVRGVNICDLIFNHPPESGLGFAVLRASIPAQTFSDQKKVINGGMFIAHKMDLRGRDKTAHRKKSQCRDYTSCLAVYTVAR